MNPETKKKDVCDNCGMKTDGVCAYWHHGVYNPKAPLIKCKK